MQVCISLPSLCFRRLFPFGSSLSSIRFRRHAANYSQLWVFNNISFKRNIEITFIFVNFMIDSWIIQRDIYPNFKTFDFSSKRSILLAKQLFHSKVVYWRTKLFHWNFMNKFHLTYNNNKARFVNIYHLKRTQINISKTNHLLCAGNPLTLTVRLFSEDLKCKFGYFKHLWSEQCSCNAVYFDPCNK